MWRLLDLSVDTNSVFSRRSVGFGNEICQVWSLITRGDVTTTFYLSFPFRSWICLFVRALGGKVTRALFQWPVCHRQLRVHCTWIPTMLPVWGGTTKHWTCAACYTHAMEKPSLNCILNHTHHQAIQQNTYIKHWCHCYTKKSIHDALHLYVVQPSWPAEQQSPCLLQITIPDWVCCPLWSEDLTFQTK